MDYSYQIGLLETIWVSAAAATIGVTISVVFIIRGMQSTIGIMGELSVRAITSGMIRFFFLGLLFSGVAGLVVFCASFTILNPFLQLEQLGLAFIERELSNGVFALRIASLVICYRTLAYIAQIVLWDEMGYVHERFFDRPSKRYPELDALEEARSDDVQDGVYLAQWGVYAMVLTNLWVLTILPRESILAAVLSFGLFFIFDDWTITTEYARSLKGRIFPWHAARIHFFNVVLIVPLLILIFQEFSWPGAILSATVIIVFLFLRYVAWIGPYESLDEMPKLLRLFKRLL